MAQRLGVSAGLAATWRKALVDNGELKGAVPGKVQQRAKAAVQAGGSDPSQVQWLWEWCVKDLKRMRAAGENTVYAAQGLLKMAESVDQRAAAEAAAAAEAKEKAPESTQASILKIARGA